MVQLTKAEEEIMQIIWKIGPCTVADIRNYIHQHMREPMPPHSTISSIVRILDDKKGILLHKAYGRTYEYYPVITKEEYSRKTLRRFIKDYFEGSVDRLVSFMIKEDDLSVKDLSKLVERFEQWDEEQNKNQS